MVPFHPSGEVDSIGARPASGARPRVGLVTCEALPQLYKDDFLLVEALSAIGVDASPVVWSDPKVDWRAWDALVIRSPWDYFERLATFRPWLDARIESGVRMCNAAGILAWNLDKTYLEELTAKGVPVIPTVFVAQGERPDVAALARERGWGEIVVKPAISGNAFRTHRLRLDEVAQHAEEMTRILDDRGLLIQPFLPEILSDGELSLLFFDGAFSHAVRKRPTGGDYRVQLEFGGAHETVVPRPEHVQAALACIAAAPELPTYARVDGVIHNGQFLLMELEVFEPLLFLGHHAPAAGHFARAIQRRLS